MPHWRKHLRERNDKDQLTAGTQAAANSLDEEIAARVSNARAAGCSLRLGEQLWGFGNALGKAKRACAFHGFPAGAARDLSPPAFQR
jgi:hypothetical protein